MASTTNGSGSQPERSTWKTMMSERTWGRNTYKPGVNGLRPVRLPFFVRNSVYGQREFTGDDMCVPHIFKGILSKCVQTDSHTLIMFEMYSDLPESIKVYPFMFSFSILLFSSSHSWNPNTNPISCLRTMNDLTINGHSDLFKTT